VSAGRLHPEIARELIRCKGDFAHFCTTYLRIVDKSGVLIPLIPHDAQHEILDLLDGNLWSFVLKARRIGCTTIVSAWIFWRCLFGPHLKAAVLAHLSESAEGIFETYHTFYAELPEWMRVLFPTKKSNVRAIEFSHGGRIRVASARTEKLRGGGYQIVHADEVAMYSDVQRMMRSAFSAADGGASIIMSTTANGVNEAYHFWHATGSFSQSRYFKKHFVSWLADATARTSKDSPEYVEPFTDPGLMLWESELRARCPGITAEQLAYARVQFIKLGGSPDNFDQEFPTEAALAFILSGKPYFSKRFDEALGHEPVEGLIVQDDPIDYRTYAMGVDTAGGVPGGDYSACYVVDVSDRDRPVEVASLYIRMNVEPFADAALDLARKYNAYVAIERTGIGLAVVQRFKHSGYPYLFRTTVPGKVGQESTERIGWDASERSRPAMLSALQSAINLGRLEPIDPRLKNEINTFVWDKTGRPDHQGGAHSDMIVAAGLALIAASQSEEVHAEDMRMAHRPINAPERIKWEMATGRLYDPSDAYADDRPRSLDEGVTLDVLLSP